MTDSGRTNRTNIKRAYILNYLATHPCIDCGEADPVVLEFDHIRDKTANVSRLMTANASILRIAEEIAKCEVCCANCHRKRTAKTYGSYRTESLESLSEKLRPSTPVNSKSRLNYSLAEEIRGKYVRNVYGFKRLAKEYGVVKSSIRAIVENKTYPHLSSD